MSDLSSEQLQNLLAEHGSVTAVAQHLGTPRTTVRGWYARMTTGTATPRKTKPVQVPHVTKDMLDAALLPPNNCQVGRLLNAIREAGQEDTLETVEMMLALPAREVSASQFNATLKAWGFSDDLIPDKNHVGPHRNQQSPCRCASYAAVGR